MRLTPLVIWKFGFKPPTSSFSMMESIPFEWRYAFVTCASISVPNLLMTMSLSLVGMTFFLPDGGCPSRCSVDDSPHDGKWFGVNGQLSNGAPTIDSGRRHCDVAGQRNDPASIEE